MNYLALKFDDDFIELFVNRFNYGHFEETEVWKLGWNSYLKGIPVQTPLDFFYTIKEIYNYFFEGQYPHLNQKFFQTTHYVLSNFQEVYLDSVQRQVAFKDEADLDSEYSDSTLFAF